MCSIKHWDQICSAKEVDYYNINAGILLSTSYCALCQKYYDLPRGCYSVCVVGKYSNVGCGDGSLFAKAYDAYFDWHVVSSTREHYKYFKRFKYHARNMLNFLKKIYAAEFRGIGVCPKNYVIK